MVNQKMLTTYLSRMEVTVELAENGRIAVEKFEPGKFDLILMDVAMPEMDGLEATRKIQESSANVPPILLLTAHVMDAIQTEAEQVGVHKVLSKPIPFDELKAELAIVLSTSNRAKANKHGKSTEDFEAPSRPAFMSLMSDQIANDLVDLFSAEDLAGIVEQYVGDGQKILADIKRAYNAADFEALAAHAHSLKGSSALLGFVDVVEKSGFLETHAKNIERAALNDIEQSILKFFAHIRGLLS